MKKQFLTKALAWVKKKQTLEIKSISEGYHNPKEFYNKTRDVKIMPDISFTTNSGARHYTEIALKDEKPESLISKWKFLSLMASMKKGKLHLLAPRGHKSFVSNLIKQNNIDAAVHSI